MEKSKHSNSKNENIETKYLNNTISKVKNNLFDLEKDFTELKGIKIKIKREIDVLFFKPILVSIDNMDRFERKQMEKKRPIKNTSHDWLIHYIIKPITKPYYKLLRVAISGTTIILNMEVTVIKIKTNQKKQNRTKLKTLLDRYNIKVNEPQYKRCGVTPHFPKTKK